MATDRVLVTGGTGFVGAHCLVDLLAHGYTVRTTVRDLKRAEDIRAMLRVGGVAEDAIAGVEFAQANLLEDTGWQAAVAGCTYVQHVASPFPEHVPKDENELIAPAREGTLRVLRAARDAGVRRVVVTSSFAAIGYGHPASKQRFDENDWTIVDGPGVFPYQKSKTLAERAAWEFVRREGVGMELSVVNPVGIFGPVLGPDYSTSIVLLKRVLRGDVPGMPNFSFGIVDVRDVASLHRLAMVSPEAAGERFLSTTEHFIPAVEMAKILKERMGAQGRRVKVHVLPNFMIKLVALFDKGVAQVVPELGKVKDATSEKAQRVLGWQPRSVVEAIVSSGESLERLGLLKG